MAGNQEKTKRIIILLFNLLKIKNGEDKRTSVILINLPVDMTKEKLSNLLVGVGNINFIYI